MAFQLCWYHQSEAGAPHRGLRVLKYADSVTVGREVGVDILLKDGGVSRLHAEIWLDSSGVHVKDTNSSNGIKLDGRRVATAHWLPGQKVKIGPFVFELEAKESDPNLEINVPSRINQMPDRVGGAPDPGQRGRIKLGEVYRRATRNDKDAIQTLFQGFLGRTEHVIECGYLGAYGLIFPANCFWCVTDRRVCGMVVNYAGWVWFQFGFIKSLNRVNFNQPSLIVLWLVVIFWLLFVLSLLVSAIVAIVNSAPLFVILLLFLSTAGVFALTPAVVWLYYRFEKAGCVFWTRELVPIWIFSDRHNIRAAQRFISVFMDQKQALGD